jgi:hypothetical protein
MISNFYYRLINHYRNWLYEQDMNPSGLLEFLKTVKVWWKLRPTVIQCARCQQKIWHNGQPQVHRYCDQYCAFYGPEQIISSDEVPF